MSADLLRRAAAELRDAATHVPPSPWKVHESPGGSALAVVSTAPSERVSGRSGAILKRATTQVAMSPLRRGHRQNIAYIALMHPDVALALADWLEEVAAQADRHAAWAYEASEITDGYPAALARAILGEVPDVG